MCACEKILHFCYLLPAGHCYSPLLVAASLLPLLYFSYFAGKTSDSAPEGRTSLLDIGGCVLCVCAGRGPAVCITWVDLALKV